MALVVRLSEILTPSMLETHQQHISDFLQQEGIPFDPDNLAAAELTERQIKELLEELAENPV